MQLVEIQIGKTFLVENLDIAYFVHSQKYIFPILISPNKDVFHDHCQPDSICNLVAPMQKFEDWMSAIGRKSWSKEWSTLF